MPMRVTLRQLKVFEAVVRNMSYTRAAEDLYLNQPAVSMQIKQLEENIGLALFEQIGRKIFLTQAGEEMHRYARNVHLQLEEAQAVMENLKGLRRGRLKLGVASTANHFTTQLLAAFVAANEDISFSLDVTNREILLRQLENNEQDLVIMGRTPKDCDLEEYAFMTNPLVMIAPVGHRLVGRTAITLDELAGETFVVREFGSGTRIAMENMFEKRGVDLSTRLEMSTNEAIKQAVEAGLGLGVVSLHTLDLELGSGRLALLNVTGFPIRRQWFVVHRKGKRLSPLAAAFKEFVLHDAGRFCDLTTASTDDNGKDGSWCEECPQECEAKASSD